MATYQLLLLDAKDRVRSAQAITGDTDEEAIARASRIVYHSAAELWVGRRLVKRFERHVGPADSSRTA